VSCGRPENPEIYSAVILNEVKDLRLLLQLIRQQIPGNYPNPEISHLILIEMPPTGKRLSLAP
jgi:hypothetical protein